MPKHSIKSISLRLLFSVVTLSFFLISNELSAQSRRALRQQAKELSYQQAGVSSAPVSKNDKGESNPNAMAVRSASQAQAQSNSLLTPTQRMICELTNSKADLQKEIDQLGEQLQQTRGSKARKITEELEVFANEMELIDLKLAALPKQQPVPESYLNNKPLHNLVDSLVESKLEKDGYIRAGNTPINSISTRIVYHVQLAVTTLPNPRAFSNLKEVNMQQRPDGKYAYYYGSYSNYSQAQTVCMRLRSGSKYRDAFVVALQGTQRITIQQAAKLAR